jgi:hypothetical protein
MPRLFTEEITTLKLAERIIQAVKANKGTNREFEDEIDEDANPIDFVYENQYSLGLPYLTAQVEKDLKKVKFDSENHECKPEEAYCGAESIAGFQTLRNGLTYLGCVSGGDWECPLFYIIYWDGGKLRAYIPTDGNLWNTDTKMAYGNDDEELEDDTLDAKNIKKRFGVDVEHHSDFDAEFDCTKIERDIVSRIQPAGHLGVSTPPAPPVVKPGLKRYKFEGIVEAENEEQAILILVKNLGLLEITEL